MPHIHIVSISNPSVRGAPGTSAGKSAASADGENTTTGFGALLEAGLDAVDALTIKEESGPPAHETLPGASDFVPVSLPVTTRFEPSNNDIAIASEDVSEAIEKPLPGKLTAAIFPDDPRDGVEFEDNIRDARHALHGRRASSPAGILNASSRPAGEALSAIRDHLPASATPLNVTPLSAESANFATAPPAHAQGFGATIQLPQESAPVAKASIEVAQRIGSNAWTDSFTQKVVVFARRNEQVAEIRLNPPHLGPIEVTLALSGEEQRNATIHFSSHQASVREAIENALPRLRELFGEAGIELGNATVGSGSSERDDAASNRSKSASDSVHPGDAPSGDIESRSITLGISPGSVDTFA